MKEQALESGWGSILDRPVTNIILGKMLIFCENAPCFGFLWGWSDGSKVPCLHGAWYCFLKLMSLCYTGCYGDCRSRGCSQKADSKDDNS